MSEIPMRCAMTGMVIRDSGDGVWDDGEWISWAYINEQIDRQENEPAPETAVEDDEREEEVDPVLQEPDLELLNRMVAARNHFENTLDQISPDWGPIGETYVARHFGVKLCNRHTQGHDGRLGDELIEIKTITPYKNRPCVQVKRAGNFSLLAIVRIADDHNIEVRFVPRNKLPAGDGGKYLIIAWSTACRIGHKTPTP